jgi:PIN domain nuclease of toxin-antitoxin system
MVRLEQLPRIHREPLERHLVAQALRHALRLFTIDPSFLAYLRDALSVD